MKKSTIRLTNSFVIFIMTGIIYVFMEVFFTSILSNEMINKYKFKVPDEKTFDKMDCKPCQERILIGEIKKLSLIGASSIWMLLVGGLSGLCLYGLYKLINKKINLFFASLIGSIIITVLELLSGILLNCKLKLYIWDYSDKFINFMGQICLSHFIMYLIFICPVAFWFFHFLESQYEETSKKSYSLFKHYKNLVNPFSKNISRMIDLLSGEK